MNDDMLNESFGTLSETINGLVKLGYTHDFNIHEECLVCHQMNITLSPDDFQIDKVYRFEGASDPEDQAILYAISSTKFDVKGTLVNGYGISADESTSKLIEKLQTHTAPVTLINSVNEVSQQQTIGNPILNTQLVEVNFYKYIDQLKEGTTWANGKQSTVSIFKSEAMRIVLIGLPANAEIQPHKANGVISVQVLEGKIQFITEKQNVLIQKGQMIVLQEKIMHSVRALTDSFFLLTLVTL